MKVTFSSEAWVEMRGSDELTARDKAAMYDATFLPSPMTADMSGARLPATVSMGLIEQQTYAVLASVIITWSYQFPLPKDDGSVDLEGHLTWDESLKRLPLDDWNELEEAVAPHLAKLRSGGPKGPRTPATSSTSNGTSRARAGSSRKASPKAS